MAFSLPVFLVIGAAELMKRNRQGKPLPPRNAVIGALLIGLIGYYLAMVLRLAGLLYVTAQLERLALFTYPIFLIFIGWAFFGMKLTRWSIAAAVLSYLGLAFVFATDFSVSGSNVALGTALVLGWQ